MLITPEWENIISEIISTPGIAMVVGGVDVGKTSFCLQLCNAAFEAGIPTAIVDADVGQSEIGAPGTIGMAMVDRIVDSLSHLKPKRLYFVGSTTPVGHLLECTVGTKKMVDAALHQGAKLVVVDTTGLVQGAIARKLKTYKTDHVRPNYLIGIQKRREIEHLLTPFRKISSIDIRRLSVSEEARRKPPEFRAARRRLNFYEHFHDARGHIIRLDDVCFWNTWFGSGRPMKWQYMKFVEDTLKCRILYAEVTGTGVFIVSERTCQNKGYRVLEEQFRTRDITVVTADAFKNLLVGLGDENGSILNVGLIQAVDFKQRFMFVLSPIKTISPIRVVQFGSIKVNKDGVELGKIKPGEL